MRPASMGVEIPSIQIRRIITRRKEDLSHLIRTMMDHLKY
jgi:hypothetical protein